MAELELDDVRAFNSALESVDDDVLQAALDAALAAARRYCGWMVTPVAEDVELTVDGTGGRTLSLPTMNLLEVSEVVENGVALDVTKLDVSRVKGAVEKQWPGCWTCRLGAITVTFTHGFTEEEAADWRRAVLSMVNSAAGAVPAGAVRMVAGPFQFETTSTGSGFSVAEKSVFDSYRILPVW